MYINVKCKHKNGIFNAKLCCSVEFVTRKKLLGWLDSHEIATWNFIVFYTHAEITKQGGLIKSAT